MSVVDMTKELLAGGIVFVAFDGDVLPNGGGVGIPLTVGPLAKPSVDPIENWQQMTCVMRMQQGKNRENFGDKECFDHVSRTYMKEPRNKTVLRYFEVELEETNAIVQQLSYGVKDRVQAGVSQVIGEDSTERVYCWMKAQIADVDLGTDHAVFDVYGYFELEQNPEVSKDYQKPLLKFTVQPQPGNVIVFN